MSQSPYDKHRAESDRLSPRERRRRYALYIALILGCFAFWIAVLAAAVPNWP